MIDSPRDGHGRNDRVPAPNFLTELFGNPLDPGYADAAARRRDAPVSGRRAPFRTVSVAVMVVLGFLFAVAYLQTIEEEPGRSQARSGLVTQIREREGETDRLTVRADRLREEVSRQRDAALTDRDAARLRDLEATTGLGRVRGDGVVVRVVDAPKNADSVAGAGGGSGPGRVLYSDLQRVANSLWGAGAEAVAINGQRLTATSTIRSAGQAILVDFRPVTGPYEVSAIGPGGMKRRFEESGTAALLRRVSTETGLSFGVRVAEDLTLSAAQEPQLRYARPAVTPTPSVSDIDRFNAPQPFGSGTSPRPSGGGR